MSNTPTTIQRVSFVISLLLVAPLLSYDAQFSDVGVVSR